MNLPSEIKKAIGDRPYELDDIGMSGSQVLLFDDMVLKIQPESAEAGNERTMMRWLGGKLSVPEIICHQIDNGRSYLLMSRMGGKMSCNIRFVENPDRLVDILSEGLRRLWSIDISDCPCDNLLEQRLADAEYNIKSGAVDLNDVEPDTFGENGFKDPDDLLDWLKANRPEEDVVLSHGDFCLPNVFVKADGVCGFIDLGKAGRADRYQDIALCYRSLKHNSLGLYGGHEPVEFDADILFERLGIEPDWEKIRYFTLLDELF